MVDHFQAELERRGLKLPGSIEICGVFCDLMWKPRPISLRCFRVRTGIVIDAISFAIAYLNGNDLVSIQVARMAPCFRREE
jgi:hypothetical protein